MTKFGRVPIRRLRCGKCGSPPTYVTEIGSITMQFCVTQDGRFREAEGIQEAGDVDHVIASCACGHRWRVRGAVQVTGLDIGPEQA